MKGLVFIDVETTGLDPRVHEIIEIGAIRVTSELELPEGGGRAVLDERVRPQHIELADARALEVNGYTEAGWSCARGLREVLEQLSPMLEGSIPAGHNVPFDLAFLQQAYRDVDLPLPAMDYHRVDTATLSWLLAAGGVHDLGSMSLDATCAALGIQRATPHRAYEDAGASLEVARRVRDLVGASSRAFRAVTQRGER